jgi:hypothetical protein
MVDSSDERKNPSIGKFGKPRWPDCGLRDHFSDNGVQMVIKIVVSKFALAVRHDRLDGLANTKRNDTVLRVAGKVSLPRRTRDRSFVRCDRSDAL